MSENKMTIEQLLGISKERQDQYLEYENVKEYLNTPITDFIFENDASQIIYNEPTDFTELENGSKIMKRTVKEIKKIDKPIYENFIKKLTDEQKTNLDLFHKNIMWISALKSNLKHFKNAIEAIDLYKELSIYRELGDKAKVHVSNFESFLSDNSKITLRNYKQFDLEQIKGKIGELQDKQHELFNLISLSNYKESRELHKRIEQLEQQLKRIAELEKLPYFNLHGNTLIKVLKKILTNPTQFENSKVYAKFEIKEIGDIAVITYESDTFKIKINLKQYSQLFKKSIINGVKIFNFILQKLNEQNFNEIIIFNLKELVDNGTYESIRSAYKGLNINLKKFQNIEIEAIEKKGNKEIRCLRTPLISSIDISFNICSINVPPPIRKDFSKYLTLMPKWSYHLTDKAHCLLDYICYLARQNSEKFKDKDKKKFTIRFDSIRVQLGLPNPEDTQKHKEKIINPILEVINEIEKKQLDYKTGIKLTPIYINPNYENAIFYKNVKEFLASKLEIELDEIFNNYLFKRAIEKEKEYKKAKNRHEKALIIAESKKIEKNSV